MNYPKLVLKPKRERSVLHRHPWVFSGAMASIPPAAGEGDIAEVRSSEGVVLGYGFYSQKSQIICRMFHWGDEKTDFESAEYWQQKIQRALELRNSQVITPGTNAYRLLHAEGDFMPGIILDIYAEVAVMQLLVQGAERRKNLIREALQMLGFNNIYTRYKTSSEKLEDISTGSGWLSGEAESPVVVVENGLNFKIDFIEGQKTGFFLDQRDNRQLLRMLSKGKKVLNCFSYTGGFSVYAFAGGADLVHSVDISESAIKACDENVSLNLATNPNAKHLSFIKDCFEYLREMPENEYDIIVLDPPAFAKHARAVENAARGYKQINMRAIQKIKPGGMIFTFSCSQNISTELFRKIVFGAAADAKRNVRIIHQLHQPADHPINIYHPEGEYLKGLVLWVE
jgi:23S rRNA (cytosine1962-C5)-methyltransferase